MNLEWVKRSFFARLVVKFLGDNGPVWSVSIAWGGLFAMFPIILGLASLVGLGLGFTGVTESQLFDGVLSHVPDAKVRTDIALALDGVRRHSGLFGLIGLVGLYFSATSLFGAVEQALAVVYRSKPRTFVKSRLMGIAMMLIFAIFATVTVFSESALARVNDLPIAGSVASGVVPVAVQLVVGVVAGILLFGTIYYVVPPLKVKLTDVLPGAIVAGILFEVIGLIFPLYISLGGGTATYGQFFAVFFILLTYFYLLGLITMIGAEVNAVVRPVAVPDAPSDASLAPEREEAPDGAGAHSGPRLPLPVTLAVGLAAMALGLLVGWRQKRD